MKKLLLAGAILALLCGQAEAADNTTVLNSTGGTVTMRCKDTGGGILACTSTIADSTGALVDPATSGAQATTNTDLGAPGAPACTTDTASCSINAYLQRLAQRLTTVNTTLGSPFQAGGSIGNTAFALNAGSNLVGKVGIDQTTPGTTDSVTPKATEAHLGEIGGHTSIISANFTTTATTTALADGQLLANSATAGSVTPLDFSGVCRVNQGTGMIRRARLKIPDTGLAGKILLLKLYRDSPTVTNGDHGTWLSTESNYIGQIQVTMDQHFSDPFEKGVGGPTVGNEINFDCASASTHLYGLIVASGASGTLQGSKTLTAVLEAIVN